LILKRLIVFDSLKRTS